MTVIALPQKIEKDLRDTSEKMGLSVGDFLTNAVVYYSKLMKEKLDIKGELKLWADASDIDLAKFERKISK